MKNRFIEFGNNIIDLERVCIIRHSKTEIEISYHPSPIDRIAYL